MALRAHAQYPPFTKWYQNPLGFQPLSLQASNSIVLPALAATAILLLTKKDGSIRGGISQYADLGISFGYYGSRTTIYQSNIGLLLPVRKFMTLGAEFTTYHVYDTVNNTWGFGVRPFVRFNIIHHQNFELFFQSGAGLIYFLEPFPKPSGFFGDYRMGTRLNGCPKYGIGSSFHLSKRISGQVGIWHVHVSNGNHPSGERNPGHDSDGFSMGLIYRPS